MKFDLGTLDSGERSLPFGLLVFIIFLFYSMQNLTWFIYFPFFPNEVCSSRS